MNTFSRKDFIKTSSLAITALAANRFIGDPSQIIAAPAANELLTLCSQLSEEWGKTLLSLQVKDINHENYGAIIYSPENIAHGRTGDTIYPFLHLAKRTNDHAYIDASVLLYRWMEKNVSQEDGSWLNEPEKGSWKGTTVFTTIALGEALLKYEDTLDPAFRQELMDRLHKSASFIYHNFSITYGNINYPVAASYGLSLMGQLLDIKKYTDRGRELAHAALPFFTKTDHFLQGEGSTDFKPSPKGCFSIDLGYNVEESLPSLVQYSLLTNDTEVMEATIRSMETHLEFMLPDGGWDNSWGTRNYKWTYWGSRTSDGCLPAYGLLAQKNPAFYTAALRNTQLLSSCTKDGILYGGPHYVSHGVPASVHHTFCHLKTLVTILDHNNIVPSLTIDQPTLPREKRYGARFFPDIQTYLVSRGAYRATITGYDKNYKEFKAGHPSGGALTMLWHEKAGIILSGSMNEYQLYEAGNMQKDTDPLSMPLTPRAELMIDGIRYTNINDFSADIIEIKNKEDITIRTRSKLVDANQQYPATGAIDCHVDYCFKKQKVLIHFKCEGNTKKVQIILPVISSSTELFGMPDANTLIIKRQPVNIKISSDKKLTVLPTTSRGRVFNYVPGLEAIPICIYDNEAEIVLETDLLNM